MYRLTCSLLLCVSNVLSGQEQLADAATTGPRFLLATSPKHVVPVDVSRTPMLRRQVSLDLDGLSVRDALAKISSETGIDIGYATDLVPFDAIVHLKADEITVAAALTDVLSDAPVDIVFTKDGRATIVSRGAASAIMATGTITGHVTAAVSGDPVTGVTVRVADSKLGAVTGEDGQYRIEQVPEGTHVLHVTRIGFARDSQTVTVVAGQTVVADFNLHEVAVRLSEVVSIGYETQSRRDLTGAVASVSSSDITEAPVPQFDQALIGKAPGVTIVTSNGQPGTSSEVRIRGGNSITAGNDPLYVIDGIPLLQSPEELRVGGTSTLEVQGATGLSPLAGLNPDDIQSIDVLKDASATSIYGARAANGVILITTKRGHSGAPVVQMSGYYGSSSVRNKLPLLNAQQFATVANEAREANGGMPLYTPGQINGFGTGTNWQDQIFRAAPTSNVDLSVSGGNPDTRYFVSGNLIQQEGVIVGTDLTRGAVRLNLDDNLGKKFRVNGNMTASREQGDIMPNGGNGADVSSVLLNAIQANPTLPVKSSDGSYFIGVDPASQLIFANPVAAARLMTNQETQDRVVGGLNAEWDLVPHLTLRNAPGIDYLSSLQDFYSPSTTYPGILFGGQGSRGQVDATTWLDETTLRYANTINSFSALDLLGGMTFQRTNFQTISGQSQTFNTDNLGPNGLDNAATFLGVFTGSPHNSLESYFGRANYSVLDRYLFTATIRDDGSSKFGQNNRYAIFPSGAFAWRASQEPFLRGLNFFDDLKVRLSYGVTGNQDIGNYNSLATLTNNPYLFGDERVSGYAPTTLANPNLKWETTDQFDAGIDLSVFKNRISVTADYYNKKTHDLLLDVPIPSYFGYTTQLQNIGDLQNIGEELGLNTVNLTGKLGWTTSLNLAWNANKITKLGNGGDTIIINPTVPGGVGNGAVINPTVLKVGQPIDAFYGYVYNGMVNGQPTYKDLYHLGSSNGVVSSGDQTIIGNAQPLYTGGMTNHFTLGRFGLTVFLQWSVGNKIYDINRALLLQDNGTGNQLVDTYFDAGKNGVPAPMSGNLGFQTRPSTLFVEDGTYLRGKNIRFDFNLPGYWLRYMRLGNATNVQLYVSAQNFFTVTKYPGFDPEVSQYATTPLAQGIDFGSYPQTRQFTIGFNAGF
jgi:TonB-dependent starch-binding outer membrane protein SusC